MDKMRTPDSAYSYLFPWLTSATVGTVVGLLTLRLIGGASATGLLGFWLVGGIAAGLTFFAIELRKLQRASAQRHRTPRRHPAHGDRTAYPRLADLSSSSRHAA